MVRQTRHLRISKKGNKFLAGNGKKKSKKRYRTTNTLSTNDKKDVLKEYFNEIKKDLKVKKKTKIPGIGTFHIKSKRARKGGRIVHAFGKQYITKSKPKTKIIKFRPAHDLKINI